MSHQVNITGQITPAGAVTSVTTTISDEATPDTVLVSIAFSLLLGVGLFFLLPTAAANEAVGLNEMPHRCEQQHHCRIRHRDAIAVGTVRDGDPAAGAGVQGAVSACGTAMTSRPPAARRRRSVGRKR